MSILPKDKHGIKNKVSARAAFDAASSIAYADSSYPIFALDSQPQPANKLTSRPNPIAPGPAPVPAPAVHDTKHTEPPRSPQLIYNKKQKNKRKYRIHIPFPSQRNAEIRVLTQIRRHK